MKLIAILVVAAVQVPLSDNLNDIRTVYRSAINNSSKADDLVKKTERNRYISGLTRAYYGSGIALQAKHSLNPFIKLNKAKTAAYELNVAVNMQPDDLEVRFLRFSFEANLPSVVNVTRHLAEDKATVLKKLDKKNPLWDIIKPFLLASDQLNETEKKKVKEL